MSRNWGKPLAVVLFLVLLAAVAGLHFMPIDPTPIEAAAQARFGQPVKIGAMHLSLVPAARTQTRPHHPRCQRRGLDRLRQGQPGARQRLRLEQGVQVGGARRRDVAGCMGRRGAARTRRCRPAAHRPRHHAGREVDAPGLALPALDVDATMAPDGALRSALINTQDKKQALRIEMKDGVAAVELTGTPFHLPFASPVEFEDFTGKGTLDLNGLVLESFEATGLGGSFKGKARTRMGEWLEPRGRHVGAHADAGKVAGPLIQSGVLDAQGTFAMRAPVPARLGASLRAEANFVAQKGAVGMVDLSRAFQGSTVPGGVTPFSELNGVASLSGGAVQFRQVRLVAGLLSATGDAVVDAQKNLSGRFQAELRQQARIGITLGGTASAPQIRR